MKKREFRINPHTFVRVYDDLVYLENQVSHTYAFLKFEDFGGLTQMGYDITRFIDDFCNCCEDSVRIKSLFEQMNDAWLIDIDGETESFERKFSYGNKSYIERRFGDFQGIGEKNNMKPTLRNLQIELTDACNERCVHCYLPSSKKNDCKSLSLEETLDLLHQYREMEGLKVVFSGGEILLHKHLFTILDECRKLNFMILLQTNLLALTEECLQKIIQLDVFNIQVSLYSLDESVHDKITRKKGALKKTKRNLELLVDSNIPVMISCPVMQDNYSTVRELKDYAEKLNVDIYFDFVMMAECNGCTDNLKQRLTIEQTKQMLGFYIESTPYLMKSIQESVSLEDAFSKKYARRRTMCSIMSISVCVDSDGTIYPCPGWNGMKLGNIHETKLHAVWFGVKANELRNLDSSKYSLCTNCNLHNFCDMCAVYNYNENGDLYDICPRFCEMAKILRECVIKKYNELH